MKMTLIFSVCLSVAVLKMTKSNGRNSVIHNVLDLYPEFRQLQDTVNSLQRQLNETKQKVSDACLSPYSYNGVLKLCWRLETTKRKTWLDARSQCGSEGGDLIIVDTPAKVSFIQNTLNKSPEVTIPDRYVYVGGNDMGEEGKWKWINGEPVQGVLWYYLKPSGGASRQCLAVDPAYGPSGSFIDVHCDTAYSFLCEKN